MPLVLARLGRRRRLVVGLLLLAQLLVEERRQVGRVAIAAAAPALLTRHLTALHVGLGAQELIERLPLVWQGGRRLQLLERGRGPAHGLDRQAHRVVTHFVHGGGPTAPARRATAGGLELVAGFLRRTLFERALRGGQRLDVLSRSSPARAPPAAVDLPGSDDDLLLRRGQVLHALRLRARGHRLALRGHELVVERLHLEEVDITARFRRRLTAADVARPHVVGHEVAGRHFEILEEQQVPAVDGEAVARAGERHDHFGIAGLLQHEVEAAHAEVVVGTGLDQHFLEWRHLAVAGGPHDPHVGGPVEQRADEVLGVVGRLDAVVLDEGHAIRAIGPHDEATRGQAPVDAERHARAVGQHDSAGRHRTVGGDREAHGGALGRVDVAAVFFPARFQFQGRRIGVVEVDALDRGRMHDRDGVVGRAEAAGPHAVGEGGRHLGHGDRERAAITSDHRHRGGSGAVAGQERRGERCHPTQDARHDRDRAASAHAHVTGLDSDLEARRHDVGGGHAQRIRRRSQEEGGGHDQRGPCAQGGTTCVGQILGAHDAIGAVG